MRTFTMSLMLGAAALMVSAMPVYAQEAAEVICGGEGNRFRVPHNDVSVCEVDPVIAEAGQELQIVRNRPLLFGGIPRPGIVGYGTWVDWEADPAGPAISEVRYEYNPDFRRAAGREYVQFPDGDPVIRVVKAGRAWNESQLPGMNPVDVDDPALAALRQARIWLTPHGIIAAAAFTAKGLCPTANLSSEDDPELCPDHSVEVVDNDTINVTLYGADYTVTLGDNRRPARVEATVNGTSLVATYGTYRNGTGMGGQPSDEQIALWIDAGDIDALAESNGPLDKFRVGVYYPEQMTLEVNGNTVLDIEITQGWTGKYQPFPDPELVIAAQ